MSIEEILKSVEEDNVQNLPVMKRNVYVADLDMTVNTDLQTADEINYATKTQVLEQPKQEYMGLKQCENPFKLAFGASVDGLKKVLDTVVPKEAIEPVKELSKGGVIAGVSFGKLGWDAIKIFSNEFKMNSDKLEKEIEATGMFLTSKMSKEDYEKNITNSILGRNEKTNTAREEFAKEMLESKKEFNKWVQECGFTPDSKAGQFFYDLGGGIVNLGLNVIAFAFAKNPMVTIGMLSLPSFTETYTKAIEEGKDTDTAMKSGMKNYAWTVGTEYLGMKVLWSTLTKNGVVNKYVRKICSSIPKTAISLFSGVEEGLQEATQNVGTAFIESYYDIAQLKRDEVIKDSLYQGFIAFTSALLFGAVASNIQFNKIIKAQKEKLLKLKDSDGKQLYTPEQAQSLAERTANQVQSDEIINEITNISKTERENSLSKEARNPQEFKKVLEENLAKMETALPEIKKELTDIKTKVKDYSLGIGLDENQATMVAEITQARAMMYYNAFGITPLQFYYLNELEITVDENSNILSNGRETGYTVRFNEEKVLQALSSNDIGNIIKSIRTRENLDKFGNLINRLVSEGKLSKEERSDIYSKISERYDELPTQEQVIDKVRAEQVEKFNQSMEINPEANIVEGVNANTQVKVVDLTGQEIGVTWNETRKVKNKEKKLIEELLVERLENLINEKPITTKDKKAILRIVETSKRAYKEDVYVPEHLAHSSHIDRTVQPEKNASVNNIVDLMKNSVMIEKNKNTDINGKPDVDFYYRFYVPVRFGNNVYTVRLVAENKAENNIGNIVVGNVYDVIIEDNNPMKNQTGDFHSTPSGTISIAQMLQNVNDFKNGNPYIIETLEQNNQVNNNRGELIPKPANTPINEQSKSIINILQSGDKSTLVHELAHIFLRDIDVIENQGGVQDEQFKKIKSTLDKWLGKKEGQKYTVEQQEKFASGFETYLATGQAPKEELKSVFDYFKKWIGQVYNGIKNMAQITPEVKDMFDSILTLQPVGQNQQNTQNIQTQAGNGGNGNIINNNGGNINNGNSPIVPITPNAKDLGKVKNKKKGSVVKNLIEPISTRLGAIDTQLEYQMKMFEARLSLRQAKYKNDSLDFLKQTEELKKKNNQDYLNFDRALKNRDINTINSICAKYPELKKAYDKVRTMLDGIKADLEIYGVNSSLDNYFPRKINNIDGLISELEKTEDWSDIERAMKQKDPNYKNWTEAEKAEFVASYLTGYKKGVTNSSTHTKQRKIDNITDEMDRYYENSNNALLEYISSISNFLETARLLKLGKEEVYQMSSISPDGTINLSKIINNIESILGEYVKDLVANKKITREQEREIVKLLNARFNFANTNNVIAVIKSMGYLTTLGNINSVITQFGDLAYSIDNAGVFGTLRAVFGKKKITMKDIGIDHPAEDFADGIGLINQVLNKVLTATGFKAIDSLGKNTYIATTFMKYKEMIAKDEQKAFEDISRRYGDEFARDLINDIKNNVLSENLYLFAHCELSRVQPISLSEMPEAYLNSGLGRVFYSLKTFWLKQFNRIVTDNKRLIQEGIKEKNNAKIKEGATSMARLIFLFVVLGAGTDMLKDLSYMRKIDLEDTIFDNFLKLIGISRYTVYKAREEGLFSIVGDQIFNIPLGQMLDSFIREIGRVKKGKMKLKDLRIFSNIPVIGTPYYWWLGGGRTKEKKKNRKRV